MSGLIGEVVRELLFRNRDRHAIPVLDGPMRSNTALDACPVLTDAIPQPDDVAVTAAGTVYVTSGRKLFRAAGGDFSRLETAAEFDGLATGVAALPGDGVAVCVAGHGIVLLDGKGGRKTVNPQSGGPLRCPTAIAVGTQGVLFVCDGSADNGPDRWMYDLMEKRRSGRVLRIDPASGATTVLASGLGYPNGICVSVDGASLIVSEAWTHTVLRLPITEAGPSRVERPLRNLAGYPARIVRTGNGYGLALFALRTQLVDFVLTEDSYRQKMIARIDPAFWIAPALRSEGHYLEPVQGGGLKKHGSLKAWAPPRSYGLVVFLDAEFEVVSSLHSRVGGACHGITGVAAQGGKIYVASKGHDKILLASDGSVQ